VDHQLRRLPPADPGQLETERLHYEGGETRNYASYNPQVARDDMFQLGVAGPVKGSKITPVRSSSALVLSSVNANREKIYIQQPPIAASGFSSQAFAPHYPHTERKEETKTCSDCHVSKANDNNAIMAQLLLQGTNFVNFVGYNAWIGEAGHVEAATVTEWDEPQAVKGSYLQRYAYPDWFEQHKARKMELTDTHSHPTEGAANCLQLRGEYLFTAEGKGGLRVRRGQHRQQGRRSASSPRRIRRWARTRKCRRRTPPAWRCRPTSRSRRPAIRAT
jgi:hypothetical protein